MVGSQSITTWVIHLVDPFLTVDPKIRKRLEQFDLAIVRRALFIQAIIWPLIYIAHFHFNDQSKRPLELYFFYRYGMAVAILAVGAIGFRFRTSGVILRIGLVSLASLLCYVQSWSMTLGPYISHSYLVWLPLIVLASFSRSFFLPALWLVFLIYTSKHFWGQHTEVRFLFSDTAIALLILFGVHYVRRVWLDSRILQLINDDLRMEAFEAQQGYEKQIKSFVSPVLIRNIEHMTARGASLVAALDSVLRLRRAMVAVMFSDMRNFSSRSDDLAFVEQELIPSARAIIDSAEQNGGVAKQIGDAVFVYYGFDDPEESLLRGLRDGLGSSLAESMRVQSLGRRQAERFFTLTFGSAFVGNMASARHREATIIGSPANLAARIDALTREESIAHLINGSPGVLLDCHARNAIATFSSEWDFRDIDLVKVGLNIRAYPEHTTLSFLSADKRNIDILNQLLILNEMPAFKVVGGTDG